MGILNMLLGRPEPRFRPGQLLTVSAQASRGVGKYMLPVQRRWIKPSAQTKKCWVYDGPILDVDNGKIVWATHGTCFLEASLGAIPNIR